MRLGFIGTGTITAAMVRGLKGSALAEWPVLLSPRSAAVAAELARELPGVAVAESNQAAVDGSDVVVLAVRPQDAEAVIRALRFDPARPVISLVAALAIETIRGWTGVSDVTRAIPLPFVEQQKGVTPVYPPSTVAAQIFNALGTCIEAADIDAFDGYAAASALMGTYFGIVESAKGWSVANGLPAADADLYLRGFFGSLGDVLRENPLPLTELRLAHQTRGGLNELAHDRYMAAGGGTAVEDALTAVRERIRRARGGPA